jgi:hypothetical protein
MAGVEARYEVLGCFPVFYFGWATYSYPLWRDDKKRGGELIGILSHNVLQLGEFHGNFP